jgi:thiamine-monophosphate kinase
LAAAPTPTLQEFELIARLCAKLPSSRRTILGAGDDCAIFAPGRAHQVITVDSMVEGVHFESAWTTPELLGARALTVNLSDVAAMGASATVCVVNLAVRAGLDYRFFERLYTGLRRAALAAGVDVVGGNVTRGKELAITIALIGELGSGAMRRDQARAGDAIYVTGTIGDAALGLRILNGSIKARGRDRAFLINRFLAPTARLAAGRKLARLRPLPSAIDVSDGLWQDLGHIRAASRVGVEVAADAIPLSSAYRGVLGRHPALALTGGDDYELLFCIRTSLSTAALARRLGVPVTRIGQVTKRPGARLLVEGKPISLARLAAALLVPSARRRTRLADRQLKGWDQLRNGAN